MTQIAISVKNVSKKYSIGKQKDSSLRGSLAGIFAKKAHKFDEFLALDNVSFDIQRGDVVGIIGKNGAGKSTLLKILSQITRPSAGEIEINGRVASLLEVGTGFHPELTGRENVYLNGTILGMTRKEVAAKFDEIVAFSGVEKFIDTPVKHYSSGMYVRLAFAVAAHLEPEILIIDEVLAVGDAEFQKKCLGKMKDVAGEGRTVLFVSHDLAAVKQLCNKGIFLKDGTVAYNGEMEATLDKYMASAVVQGDYHNTTFDSNQYAIKSILVKDENGNSVHHFDIHQKICLHFDINIPIKKEEYSLFVNIKTVQGTSVFSIEKPLKKEMNVLELESQFLTRGMYTMDAFIHIPRQFQAFALKDVGMWEVNDNDSELAIHGTYNYGVVFGNYKWN